MPSTASNAATRAISVVPGLAKQTSTPAASAVLTRLSAPFIRFHRPVFTVPECALFTDPACAPGTVLLRAVAELFSHSQRRRSRAACPLRGRRAVALSQHHAYEIASV